MTKAKDSGEVWKTWKDVTFFASSARVMHALAAYLGSYSCTHMAGDYKVAELDDILDQWRHDLFRADCETGRDK